MSVLLITNDYPPVISGISTVFYHIWKYLPPEKNLILAPAVSGCKLIDREQNIITWRYPYRQRGGALKKILNLIMMLLCVLRIVLQARIKLIHAGQILSSGLVGLIVKKILKRPYFLWVYGGETSEAYTRSRILFYVMKRIVSEAQKIITNSPFVTNEFLDYGIADEKIIEILPAVDSRVFSPRPKSSTLQSEYRLDGKIVLLTVSRLTPRKGHDLVLKALKKVIRRYCDVVYLIAGQGQDEPRLRSLVAEMGLEGHVRFAGYIDDTDLPDFYNLGDIYVMPNREVLVTTDSIEGFGISFIEASACEKPVIGGKSGGAAAAVIDGVTGFLVNPLDADELADKILHLIIQPDLGKEMGRKGRRRVEEEFSWIERAKIIKRLHNESAL